MDRTNMQLAIALLDQLVENGQVPKKGAVFGSFATGYMDYERVKFEMQRNTLAGREAAKTLIDGTFGEDNMFNNMPKPNNSGIILP